MKTKVILQDREGWRNGAHLLLNEDQIRLLKWLTDEGYLSEDWIPQYLESEDWKEV